MVSELDERGKAKIQSEEHRGTILKSSIPGKKKTGYEKLIGVSP